MKCESLLLYWAKRSSLKEERWIHSLEVAELGLPVCLMHLSMLPRRSPPKLCSWSCFYRQADHLVTSVNLINPCIIFFLPFKNVVFSSNSSLILSNWKGINVRLV